jgi:U5 small nuclear ribonucleoprotein component
MMEELSIKLSATEMKMNVKPLIALVCRRFFGDFQGLVDVITQHIRAPSDATRLKVAHTYTGPVDAPFTQAIGDCDPDVSRGSPPV